MSLSRTWQYAIPAMIIAAVTALKLVIGDPLGSEAPFLGYPLIVLFCGWLWGAPSAIAVTVFGALLSWYLFLPPHHAFDATPTAYVRLAAFIAEGLGMSAIVGAMHGTRGKLAAAAARSEEARNAAVKAREQTERSAGHIARLQRLTAALSAASTPEAVGRVVVEQGADALGAPMGSIVRPREDGKLEVFAHRGLTESLMQPTSVFTTDAPYPSAVAIRTGNPEWIETRALYVERYPELAQQSRFAAAVTMPLSLDGRMLGAMAFRFEENRSFDDDERALLITFAAQAAQAFERATLFARETEARKMMQTLAELTAELSQALHHAEVADLVIERGMRAFGADTCTLYILDEQDGSLELLGERGCTPAVLELIRRIPRSSDNASMRTLESGLSLWVENERQYLELYPNLAGINAKGPRAKAFWSVPLIVGGRPIGLLAMGFFEPRRFSPEERQFVQTFSQPCAQALRRAQQLSREQEARRAAEQARSSLSTTLRSIGDAVMATDDAGLVTFMNPVAEDLTGWSEEEARGQPLRSVFHVVHEATRQEIESPIDKVLREGRVVGMANCTVLLGKHREVPIDDSGSPIRDESGAIQGVVLVFRDVSAQKREEARRSFLADVSDALSSSLDYRVTLARAAELAVPRLADWCSIDVIDAGGTGLEPLAVAHFDPAKVELARELQRKYPPDQNVTRGRPNVLRTGRPELYAEITDEILAQSAIDEQHLRLARALLLRSALIVPLTAREQVLGVITLAYAESNRRYTEEDLAFAEDFAHRAAVAVERARFYASEQRARALADASNRTKDEFLAMVSHELRTPLTAILGWARIMAASELVDDEQEHAVTVIERNAVAMAQLIDDLLDVSSITSGKMRLDLSSIDLAQIIEAAVDAVKPGADAKEIRIQARLDPGAGELVGDPARLQQVVWNLLNNAVKFTRKHGRIDVSLIRVDSSVEISVSDTGQGIDPKFLPYVFDRFRQADGSITRTHGGLGLGLAITRHLVELHGGRVEARSEGQDQGSTFVVRLPIPAVREPPQPSSDRRSRRGGAEIAALKAPPQLAGLHVLVVEDEDDARQLVRTVLERCGSRVTAVDSVKEAMEAIERERPDVLVSDIGMPGEDGYDLIKKVRAMPGSKGGNLPAAALTAYARAEDRLRVLNAGYMMHIPKPVEPAELVAVVANLTRFPAG